VHNCVNFRGYVRRRQQEFIHSIPVLEELHDRFVPGQCGIGPQDFADHGNRSVVPPVPNQHSGSQTQLLALRQQGLQVRLKRQAIYQQLSGAFIYVSLPTRHGGRPDVAATPLRSSTLDIADVLTSLLRQDCS
jgi:hypothetical protein